MQNQEILAKLNQARQAQARALQRFACAQQRLAQLEARQQALSAHLTVSTPTPDQDSLLPSTPFPAQVLTPLPDQLKETDAEGLYPASLPENGELELLADFTPASQTAYEQTDRIAPAQPAALPHTPVPFTDTPASQETSAAEDTPGEVLTGQAEECS